ncbi:carbohydrate sulfotransferase 5-like [Amphibalanus amphitrite]|uniref:carbohydrate sulfotransferase 5-like n=1 Tax=Amphibalanus amphitrite TaxID=1232801 RepID=UPI001C916441|nr:carbohydrate sulfotransferase 5-like [Amphibalanus amphitrite]XP_043241272.1 carbohydrate sulfotransferase 5-like [Amphibalanus amphitrite]XP_043241273.1 carbohydrate sulfotransferase 5-like [Amphibalanus amphitrite]
MNLMMKLTRRNMQMLPIILLISLCAYVIYVQPHRDIIAGTSLDPAPVAEADPPPAADAGSTSKPRLVVLYSSNPRSGSSFFGELLASPAGSMYLYEPLHYAQLVGHPVHKESHLSPDRQTRDFVRQELLRLLTCQFEEQMFNESLKLMIWKKPKVAPIVTESQRRSWCLELDLRVAKVIRPGLGALLPLLELPGYDIHIVHLVRDPRAVINSLRENEAWAKSTTANKVCERLTADLDEAESISSPRYTLIRYEDLISDTTEVTRFLFSRIGITMTPEVKVFIRKHTKSSKDPSPSKLLNPIQRLYSSVKQSMTSLLSRDAAPPAADSDVQRLKTEPKLPMVVTRRHRRSSRKPIWKHGVDFNGYYGTFRFADFDGLHWLKELPRAERTKAEKVCADALRRLDYPLVYPEEEGGSEGRTGQAGRSQSDSVKS